MIFLGDLASPSAKTTECIDKVFSQNKDLFQGKMIICNLEGLIYEGPGIDDSRPVLFNDPSILNSLGKDRNSIVCLANNHTLDLPGMFTATVNRLTELKIGYCGAGISRKDALNPLFFSEGNRSFALFNGCWDFLLYNHPNPSEGVHISEIREDELLSAIRELRGSSPETSIIAFFHWNLDLETLPFPMYRTFSRALIDAGASVVVGAHSHCVQGGESYKDGFICYGLGNFFLPDNEYAAGNLEFPSFSRTSLGLEWNVENNEMLCHWFEYDSSGLEHRIDYVGSDLFDGSPGLKQFSPYRGLNENEYLSFFRMNRRKRLLIPIYSDYRRRRLNRFYTMLLRVRARIARLLAQLKVIKWQN